jgi:endonuclease IV
VKNLKLIHLNDSKDKLNSNQEKKDLEHYSTINQYKKLPIIMETPIDRERDNYDNLKVVLELLDDNRKERRSRK